MVRSILSRRNKVSKRRNKISSRRNKVSKRRNKISSRRNKVSKRRNKIKYKGGSGDIPTLDGAVALCSLEPEHLKVNIGFMTEGGAGRVVEGNYKGNGVVVKVFKHKDAFIPSIYAYENMKGINFQRDDESPHEPVCIVKRETTTAGVDKIIGGIYNKQGVGGKEDEYIVVMEFIHGKDLFYTIHNKSGLKKDFSTPDLAIKYTLDVLKQLCPMHDVNIPHRDIKTDNIMIDTVTDFARLVDYDDAGKTVFCGTYDYRGTWFTEIAKRVWGIDILPHSYDNDVDEIPRTPFTAVDIDTLKKADMVSLGYCFYSMLMNGSLPNTKRSPADKSKIINDWFNDKFTTHHTDKYPGLSELLVTLVAGPQEGIPSANEVREKLLNIQGTANSVDPEINYRIKYDKSLTDKAQYIRDANIEIARVETLKRVKGVNYQAIESDVSLVESAMKEVISSNDKLKDAFIRKTLEIFIKRTLTKQLSVLLGCIARLSSKVDAAEEVVKEVEEAEAFEKLSESDQVEQVQQQEQAEIAAADEASEKERWGPFKKIGIDNFDRWKLLQTEFKQDNVATALGSTFREWYEEVGRSIY
jgi:serine/threonine protein kinase